MSARSSGGVLVERHRRLQHLEDARLVADVHAALLLGRLPELVKLAHRPLRLQVARRNDGDEERHLLELFDERFGEEIVALELGIAPDVRRLAEQLADTDLQRAMEVRDPSLAPLDQLDVVEVGVADEGVALSNS